MRDLSGFFVRSTDGRNCRIFLPLLLLLLSLHFSHDSVSCYILLARTRVLFLSVADNLKRALMARRELINVIYTELNARNYRDGQACGPHLSPLSLECSYTRGILYSWDPLRYMSINAKNTDRMVSL